MPLRHLRYLNGGHALRSLHTSPLAIQLAMDYTLTFAALIGVFSSLRTVPGPISPSWIFGHMLELMDSPTYGENESAWQKMYGTVYRVRGCLGQERLVISDPVALQYIIKSASFHHAQRKDAANVALYGAKSVTSLRGMCWPSMCVPLMPG
ncbi:hypothetical protein FB451DRAFT_1273747 [Mycena latifolia]|nr:hypothetical protein FB451DRAFT_1273747 [Mycena latifolia]